MQICQYKSSAPLELFHPEVPHGGPKNKLLTLDDIVDDDEYACHLSFLKSFAPQLCLGRDVVVYPTWL